MTTGGIRGGKVQLEKFTPRTFNMGFSRRVWERVGGFREMFSEDIDMSMRIRREGFSMGLIRQAAVYHRRRQDFAKFRRQVYVFGMSRITLKLLYPGSLKLVHTLPALFLAGTVVSVLLGAFVSPWWLLPLGLYVAALFVNALADTRSLKIALMAVPASLIQLYGYGAGFIKAFVQKILCAAGVTRRRKSISEKARMSGSELIRDLAYDDRPREKAWANGTASLTPAELIAILLRTGLKGRSVVQVSREILSICGNDLARLSRMTPAELSRLVPGIGPTKAITLMAAIELGARCQSALTLANDMPQITSSERIYSMMRPRLERLRHEEFWVLMLNRANRVESRWMVSQGGMAATVVDVRLLFKKVIDAQASAIVLVHNHPSGQLHPSAADDDLTSRISAAAELLDIRVVDHLIISPAGFYSYFDEGRLG